MPASSVMTVRLEPGLLAALKRRARQRGHTVSAEVVDLLRRELQPVQPVRSRPVFGMFPNLEAPELEELKELRRGFSARIKAKRGRL